MGEVYKGRDTRLARTVAIKVLPALLHVDPVARERFEREARAISALNHPNICTLHDVGRQDGVDFLVMEYVEGETLAARLARGPLPLDQALTYAIDLASAIDRAHRAGIVHRDIKPGNVMVGRAGVKLLDFGLAKASPTPPTAGENAQLSDVTKSRLIAGTVQYMAPEQFEGRAIDERTDIFAFGAVLYEMVSGRKAFEGSSIGSLIAAIVERDPPPLSSVRPLAPAALERIVSTCLAKDPDDRWQSARDLMRALQLVRDQPTPSGATPLRSTRRTLAVPVVVAAVGAAIAGAAVTSLWRREVSTPVQDVRFSIYPEPGSAFATLTASVVTPNFALSPDGRQVAYAAASGGPPRLWVRTLSALGSRPLEGTEDASGPFWSPDSRSIAFVAQGKLKTVQLSGGLPIVRADASRDTRGGTWAPDGTLLFSRSSTAGMSRLAPNGSLQPAFSSPESESPPLDRYPWMLPDGQHFVFGHRNRDPSVRGIYLGSLGSNARTRLTEGDWGPVVVDQYLLYLRGPVLMAQRLNVADRRLEGDPLVLLESVANSTVGYMGVSVSRTGTLAYMDPWPTNGELLWYSRAGDLLGPPVAPLADYVDISLSPDGSRVAYSRVDPQRGTGDIWLSDLARAVTTRLTSDPMNDAGPLWSSDGLRILFRTNRGGYGDVFLKSVDDVRPEELFFETSELGQMILTDLSRDGAHVIFTNVGVGSTLNLWDLPTESLRAREILQTPFDEYHGVLSPDGGWLAYVSEDTGIPQVYVQSFPNGEQRTQVSSQGGTEPRWREDGQELFFLRSDRMMMAVPVSLRPTFQAEEPKTLFRTRVPLMANAYRWHYDVSADGERFLVNTAPASVPTPAIHVVLDWRALLPRPEN